MLKRATDWFRAGSGNHQVLAGKPGGCTSGATGRERRSGSGAGSRGQRIGSGQTCPLGHGARAVVAARCRRRRCLPGQSLPGARWRAGRPFGVSLISPASTGRYRTFQGTQLAPTSPPGGAAGPSEPGRRPGSGRGFRVARRRTRDQMAVRRGRHRGTTTEHGRRDHGCRSTTGSAAGTGAGRLPGSRRPESRSVGPVGSTGSRWTRRWRPTAVGSGPRRIGGTPQCRVRGRGRCRCRGAGAGRGPRRGVARLRRRSGIGRRSGCGELDRVQERRGRRRSDGRSGSGRGAGVQRGGAGGRAPDGRGDSRLGRRRSWGPEWKGRGRGHRRGSGPEQRPRAFPWAVGTAVAATELPPKLSAPELLLPAAVPRGRVMTAAAVPSVGGRGGASSAMAAVVESASQAIPATPPRSTRRRARRARNGTDAGSTRTPHFPESSMVAYRVSPRAGASPECTRNLAGSGAENGRHRASFG